MKTKHVRRTLVAGGLGWLAALAVAATRDWIGTDPPPDNIWSDNGHWSPSGVPVQGDQVRHLTNSNGYPDILKDSDASDPPLASFEGQIANNQNRRLTLTDGQELHTTGDVFRTGNANGTYTIQVGES